MSLQELRRKIRVRYLHPVPHGPTKGRDDADNAVAAAPVIVNNTAAEPASYLKLQPIPQATWCQSTNVGMGRVHTYCN